MSSTNLAIGELLTTATEQLKSCGITDAARSAQLLLASILETDISHLVNNRTETVHSKQAEVFQQAIARRCNYEPVDYIIGSRPFHGLELNINQYTLIPRSETEQLVELVLDYIGKQYSIDQKQRLTITDVGTGSGAIAVSLAYTLRKLHYNFQLSATDTSADALTVATANAEKYRLRDRITFIKANLLKPSDETASIDPSDIVVANLPYVPRERIKDLTPEVRDFEPILALDGGPDGLDPYRQLLTQLHDYDWQPQALFFEIDETHGELATQLIQQHYPNATISVQQDLADMDRFISIIKPIS